MGAKAATYCHGDLVVIWPEGKAPKLEDATLYRIYSQIYVPALRADILRLHAVMTTWLKSDIAPDFDSYVNGLGTLKATIGRSAMPDLETVEKEIAACHKRFMASEVLDFEWDIMDIAQGHQPSEIPPTHKDFIEARYRCIGFDTSAAIRQIADHMKSDKGRAELYVATLQGRSALKNLLTVDWIKTRKDALKEPLRDRLHECTMRVHMAQSIAYARQHDTSKPKTGDLDEAMRVNRLRVVAGSACVIKPSRSR